MASTPRSSPRGSPANVPNASPKSISSAASILTSITKCLDSSRSVDDVLDDARQSLTPNKQQHSSSSHSHRTDPTAPITTSTHNKSHQQQKQLSLKTGMAMHSPSTHSNNNSNSHCHTNADTDKAAMGGSGTHFWNFHVRSADSNDSGNHAQQQTFFDDAQRHDLHNSHADTTYVSPSEPDVSFLYSSQASSPNNSTTTNESTASPKASPTSLLLSQSAKAAAEAAASIITIMESISAQLGTHVANVTERYVNMGGVSAVAFCGSPRGSPRNSPVHDQDDDKRMEGIPEENQCVVTENILNISNGTTNTNSENDNNNNNISNLLDPWDTYFCVNKDDCTFQEFDYNAFRETNEEGIVEHNDKQNQESHSNRLKSKQVGDNSQPNAAVVVEDPDPKGYEIRLKSTFSQQQMKTHRHKLLCRDSLPNSLEKEVRHSTISPPTSSATPSAFGRTHPNNTIRQLPQHQPSPPNHDVNPPSSTATTPTSRTLPFQYLSIPTTQTNNSDNHGIIERTASEVSELTMRSHGERYHRYASDSRRMAYYAVGKVNENDDGKGSGGNRRCYFTGVGILYGMPFYAGSVQQGPRTLVVFCHPSALGLPSLHPHPLNTYSKADRDRYLQSLPEPDSRLLEEMKRRYPDPFDTLPVQVRSPNNWRLFVKLCYFSGLPIAEGEMHYQVKSSVNAFRNSNIIAKDSNNQHQREEISLSHEVMEAVNGEESAEILRLPNQKTFDYLRRQYSQQSAKLNDEVFDRKSWVRVRAEV